MNVRLAATLITLAILLPVQNARAQRLSLAAGVGIPAGGLASVAANGYDIGLQVRTEPMIGPLALRIDVSLDHLAGKAEFSYHQVSQQSLSLVGDLGTMFYWMAGPGYYQMQDKTQIEGHPVADQRTYFGAQAAVGVNFPVFRWDGFLEVSAAKMFSPGPSLVYVPLRFGIRL